MNACCDRLIVVSMQVNGKWWRSGDIKSTQLHHQIYFVMNRTLPGRITLIWEEYRLAIESTVSWSDTLFYFPNPCQDVDGGKKCQFHLWMLMLILFLNIKTAYRRDQMISKFWISHCVVRKRKQWYLIYQSLKGMFWQTFFLVNRLKQSFTHIRLFLLFQPKIVSG